MGIAYLVITILLAAIVTFSGIGKIRHDPRIVQVIHELIGVPLKYFPLLAACEFAGALGVVLGIWWPLLGVAAGIGLVIYFVGASVSHCRTTHRERRVAVCSNPRATLEKRCITCAIIYRRLQKGSGRPQRTDLTLSASPRVERRRERYGHHIRELASGRPVRFRSESQTQRVQHGTG